MNRKIPLKELFESHKNRNILLLGREGLFTDEEIARFLKKYQLFATKNLDDDVVATIEARQLNPIEEEISYLAYEKKIPSYKQEHFEALLSEEINDNELLMAIKLTNDQPRIQRLLSNTHLSESLFLKLLMLYQWHDEEEDNTHDRDVIVHTLRRYIPIGINEEDLHYSYVTLRRLATEATHPQLLLALLSFPNFHFVVRGKKRVSLRETIAKNRAISEEVAKRLYAFKEVEIYRALAGNSAVSLSMLAQLLKKEDSLIYRALATNPQIDEHIFTRLLQEEERTVELLLLHQPMDKARLKSIEKANLSKEIFAILGANEHLTKEVEIELLSIQNNPLLLVYLAQNQTLSQSSLLKLYEKKEPSINEALASNVNVPSRLLEELYITECSQSISEALAQNASTPKKILRALFEKGSLAIHQALASNGAIDADILDVLKIDTRLQSQLAQNPIMKQWYASVHNYDKNAGQLS